MAFQDYTLEICADSVESAINAEKGGATRIELCANLVIGGTTPTEALFKEVKKYVGLSVHVLIRPRFGDFLYSEHEINIMKEEIIRFRELGAEGIVIGALNRDGTVDIKNMKELLMERGKMKVTFHRAFDMCKDPIQSFQEIKEMGIDILLTSGQKPSAEEGLELLKVLIRHSKDERDIFKREKGKPEVMMLGGFTADNITRILTETLGTAIHMSAKETLKSAMEYRNHEVNMGIKGFSEYEKLETNADTVNMYRRLIEKINISF